MKKRLVLVIDEHPYVARVAGSLASTLPTLIDQYREHSGLFLILCGSSMSFMEDQVLAYKSPLYGRRTALNPVSALFDEPISLLRQEVHEAGIYNAIISAIANGASRLSEIAGKVGETTGA